MQNEQIEWREPRELFALQFTLFFAELGQNDQVTTIWGVGTLVKNDADVSVTPNTFSSGLSLTDHIARCTLQFRQLSQKIGTWWNELRFCVSKMSRKFLYSWLFYGDGSHDNDVHIFQWKILADWPRFTEQEFANICCRNKKKLQNWTLIPNKLLKMICFDEQEWNYGS